MAMFSLKRAYACGLLTLTAVVPIFASAFSQQTGLSGSAYDPFAPVASQQSQPMGSASMTSRSAASSQVGFGASDYDAGFEPTVIPSNMASEPAGGTRAPGDANDEARGRAIAAARPALPNEFENYVSDIVGKPLRRFGANMLVPGARDFTTAPTTTVPLDYKLNPGDELIVGLAGSVQSSGLRLVIDPEGRVFIPRVGSVNLAGVRYGDARAVLERKLSTYYRNFQVDVSIGQLHGITVYVTGFAATPGSYTVSSLSTLVNAVLAAGGPASGGSFRSIQLRRNGRLISEFDLYALLLKGDKRGDSALQNGDVVYIAPVGAQVAVVGSVNSEAIFEAGPGDTLSDLLMFAGSVNTVAENGRIMVLDPVTPGTMGWEELKSEQAQSRVAKRGEIIRVLSGVGYARPLGQQSVLVTVSGEVARPGRYYFQPGAQVSELLAKAGGLTVEAFPFASVFTRESIRQQQRISFDRALKDMQLLLTTQPLVSANRSEQLQPAQLAAVQSVISQMQSREPDGRLVLNSNVNSRSLPDDLVLENNDSLYIPPRPLTVGVFGAVPSPASFRYADNRTIGDFLSKAGGVQKLGDKSQIFVVRANGTVIAKHRGLLKGGIMNERALPGDLIYVPVDAGRGEFWTRLKDITSVLFNGAVAAASVKVLAQ